MNVASDRFLFFFSSLAALLLSSSLPPVTPPAWHGLAVHHQSVLPRSLLEPARQVGLIRPAHHPELLGNRRARGPVRHQAGTHARLGPAGHWRLPTGAD